MRFEVTRWKTLAGGTANQTLLRRHEDLLKRYPYNAITLIFTDIWTHDV